MCKKTMGHGFRHCQIAIAILVVIIAISAGSFLAVLLIGWVVLLTRLTFVYFFGRLACDGPRSNLCLWRDTQDCCSPCVGGSLECFEGRVVSTRSDGEGVRRH